ncbi:type VI secretion system-associated FHA domain protein TagH [Aestuariibacter salexigens]|uniref:type VI secretion system-associated FHA domain protein TagH n=1 Tax=Aestuariibacter salexigens TaxID=226010 RepID=UPI0004271407|nr:type VI secretion system-associated FHA domain protein TagH [Aestuariibacter salexigens]
MTLSLTWTRFRDGQPLFEQRQSFSSNVTLGRASDNGFVVHDPEKYSSRYHARILFEGGAYVLEDTSAAGTLVNGQYHLSNGQRIELQSGDEIEIGECIITVEFAQSNPATDFTSPQTTSRPDITETPAATMYPSMGHAPAQAQSDDAFDIDDFFASDEPASPQGNSVGNYTVGDAYQPPTAQPNPVHEDIDDIFSGIAGGAQATTAQPAGQPQTSRHVIDRGASAQHSSAQNPHDIHQDTAALRAFLAELGLEPSQLIGQSKTDVMRIAGIVLRTLTEGMMGVLSARDSVKIQFDMDRTQIKNSKNNPLKFSSSPQEAMSKMLTQEPGYMDPVTSALEAVNDAKAHEMAMVSGLNAAIENTIAAFDPKKLKKELDLGFSISKSSKLWEGYCEKYERIGKSVRSNSNNLFTEHFRESYQTQIEMLAKNGRNYKGD